MEKELRKKILTKKARVAVIGLVALSTSVTTAAVVLQLQGATLNVAVLVGIFLAALDQTVVGTALLVRAVRTMLARFKVGRPERLLLPGITLNLAGCFYALLYAALFATHGGAPRIAEASSRSLGMRSRLLATNVNT